MKMFLLVVVVLASMLGGCAMWMEPAGYAVYHERPVYAYRARPVHVYRASGYHHHRGRPVAVSHVAHGQSSHGKKAVGAKSQSSGGKKAVGVKKGGRRR